MYRVTYSILNLFHVFLNRKRSIGLHLVWLGLISAPVWILIESFYISYKSDQSSSFTFYLKSTVSDSSVADYWISFLIVAIALIIVMHEHFYGESAPKNRARSVDMRSLNGASAPKLCDAYTSIVDQAGLHDDLYFVDYMYLGDREVQPSNFLPIVVGKLKTFSSEFLRRAQENEPSKPLALGAIAHVPFCFALGFLVSNKLHSNYFCWNRDKKNWVDCRQKLDSGLTSKFSLVNNDQLDDFSVKAIGISIEISSTSNPKKFEESLGLDCYVRVSVSEQKIGNIYSDDEQIRLVAEIREYLNKTILKKFPNLEEIHLTVLAQASFVMRLGADFNQNHIPKVFIHHYSPSVENSYPWGVVLIPGTQNIDWKINPPLK